MDVHQKTSTSLINTFLTEQGSHRSCSRDHKWDNRSLNIPQRPPLWKRETRKNLYRFNTPCSLAWWDHKWPVVALAHSEVFSWNLNTAHRLDHHTRSKAWMLNHDKHRTWNWRQVGWKQIQSNPRRKPLSAGKRECVTSEEDNATHTWQCYTGPVRKQTSIQMRNLSNDICVARLLFSNSVWKT